MPKLDEKIKFYTSPEVYQVNEKIVLSGRFVEVYRYEKPYYKGFPKLFFPNAHKYIRSNTKKELRSDNIRRSKQKIRRLVNCNEKDFTKFLTLTFSENLTDLKLCNKKLDIFLKKLRRLFPHLKYVAVPEFQERGAIHYHILVNIKGYISNDSMAKLWGNGFAWFRKIYNVTNLGAYISKYLTKNAINNKYFGNKKFFSSKNLNAPIIIDFYDNVQLCLNYMKNIAMTLKLEFEVLTDYLGMVYYKQFELKGRQTLFNNNII